MKYGKSGFISFFFSIIFVWYIIGRIRLFWRRYNMKGRLFGVGVVQVIRNL